MSDDDTTAALEPVAPPAANTAALAALDTSARRLLAQTARPPRNATPVPDLSTAAVPAADPPAPPAKRKHGKSGKGPTRAELQAALVAYQKGGIPGKTPLAIAPPVAPVVPLVPVVAGNPAKTAQFASGAARIARALSRFAARRWGAHWQATDEESAAFGDAAADCVAAGEEMAPSLTPWLQKAMLLAPFGVLAAVSYDLIDSRLEIDAAIERGERQRIMPADPPPTRSVRLS